MSLSENNTPVTIEAQGIDTKIVRVTHDLQDQFWITTLDEAAPSDYETTPMTREAFEQLVVDMIDLL